MNDNNEDQQRLSKIQTASSPSPTLVLTTKYYSLNIDKTLKAKLSACDSVSVSYEVKGGGVTGIMNTASFEIFRAACSTYFKNFPALEGKFIINISENKKHKAVVQQTYKVVRQQEGLDISYTLNLYPTKNSLLLNGKDTDRLIDSHLPTIHQVMINTVQEWKVDNLANLNLILSEQFSQILRQRQLTVPPDHSPQRVHMSSPTNETHTVLKRTNETHTILKNLVPEREKDTRSLRQSNRETRQKKPPKKYRVY